MKADVALTMDEYLKACCLSSHYVNPPQKDARHIPITTEDHAGLTPREHGCCCDRWGHLCPACVEKRNPQPASD